MLNNVVASDVTLQVHVITTLGSGMDQAIKWAHSPWIEQDGGKWRMSKCLEDIEKSHVQYTKAIDNCTAILVVRLSCH